MKLLIIGAGNFGSFYSQFFKGNGFQVSITDIDSKKAKELAEKNGLEFLEPKKLKKIEHDAVILAVPEKAAISLAGKIAKELKKGALLADFCSIKSRICPELEKIKRKDIEIASMHPMHGPRVKSIAGFPIIFIKIRNCGENFEKIKNAFQNANGRIVESDALEHDKTLAIVQGLTHFTQILSAKTIYDLGVDVERSLQFASPVYELYLDTIARVVTQNPRMYAEIQLANPYNEKVRQKLLKAAKELLQTCKRNDLEGLEKEIFKTSFLFEDKEFFLTCSDKAIEAIKYTEALLKSLEGKSVLFENTENKSKHYGKLKHYSSDKIVFLKGEHEVVLNPKKFRLTTREEQIAWKNQNLKKSHRDFSFIVPKALNPQTLCGLFAKKTKLNVQCIDEFDNNSGSNEKSITIRAEFFENKDHKEIEKSILEIIHGLGFKTR